MTKVNNLPSSFRDPSSNVYVEKGTLFRQINLIYKEDYDTLINSGLYKDLASRKMLIKHVEVKGHGTPTHYKTLKPEIIPFISYPYEWTFSQLKNAALLTLDIQLLAIKHGMTLKDASAYNIQYVGIDPIHIDTPSFEKYVEGVPWIAYKQFCQHFLAPLALAAHCDFRLNFLLKSYIDGIPLDLARKLLPKKTLLNFGLSSHIHLHARNQSKFSDSGKVGVKGMNFSKQSLLAIISSLRNTVSSLKLKKSATEWANYYNETNYKKRAFQVKKKLVNKFIADCKPKIIWDLGSNTGEFVEDASKKGIYSVAFDLDYLAVETAYKKAKVEKNSNLLPLILDLTNPTPAIGWANKERQSLAQRGPTDVVMALALIHHLAISNNLPFKNIAEYFSSLSKNLIIEFVPKSDSQVKRLLATREDIFPKYDDANFQAEFGKYYKTVKREPIEGSKRILYQMKSKK